MVTVPSSIFFKVFLKLFFKYSFLHFPATTFPSPIFKRFYYLLLEREEGRDKETETSICCLSYAPQVGTRPATRACALTGTFHSVGRCSTHWATPVRAPERCWLGSLSLGVGLSHPSKQLCAVGHFHHQSARRCGKGTYHCPHGQDT